ncbi:hypothetical protein [Neptunicella sp. SCSIO 80796]|uniref:hypothetical protein n=1 Tax=Neptunicella plasticusilytica TaxID=3117012 RepID=UPI003A4DF18C
MQQNLDITQSYDAEHQTVRVIGIGDGQPGDIIPMYQDAKQLAIKHSTKSILLDLSEFTISYSIENVVRITKELAQLMEGYKIARLVNYSEFRHDLIEQVSEELPFSLKNFLNVDEALEWLKKE